MLETLYEKTCLPKCSGNSLNLHFEYLNVSVAQKLTELHFFGSAAVNSCYSSHGCQKSMLEALYEKTYLPNCSGNLLNMNFGVT